MIDKPVRIQARRKFPACCGMEVGKEYTVELNVGGYYCQVLLPNGKWTENHRFEGFFERVDPEMEAALEADKCL